MNCLKLRTVNGAERLVPLGKPYTKAPDESQLKGVFDCDGKVSLARSPNRVVVKNELDAEIGPGMGDWIKVLASPVAKAMGREGCSPCEAKRLVVNAATKLKAKYGIIEAALIVKSLWTAISDGKHEQALSQLQAKLHD